MWIPTEAEAHLIHVLHEALRIIGTPKDFELTCKMAHEVRET